MQGPAVSGLRKRAFCVAGRMKGTPAAKRTRAVDLLLQTTARESGATLALTHEGTNRRLHQERVCTEIAHGLRAEGRHQESKKPAET
jgi:hypothetical protein